MADEQRELTSAVIDIHSHVIPEKVPDWTARYGYDGFISLNHTAPGTACMMRCGEPFRTIGANCWDPLIRIEERNTHGVSIDVLSVIPVMFAYDAKPEHGYDVARFLNDHIASVVQVYPKNFIGLGTLPMQDSDLAVRELERCVRDLGMAGVEIGTRVNGLDLDNARFTEIFAAAEALNAALFVHPWEMAQGERLRDNWGEWMLGMPHETAIAMTKLGFNARILERFPKLRIGFAHGGGVMPWLRGRLLHGWKKRPELFSEISPDSFLNRYYYDSHLSDPGALRFLLDQVGASQIMLGSDYPFPLGEDTPGRLIRELQLDRQTEAQLLGQTALKFLGRI